MSFIYQNKGVCSRSTEVTLNEDGTIKDIAVIGGCDGNLKGLCALLRGTKAEDAIARMEGITCGNKASSCPDQMAKALKAALKQ